MLIKIDVREKELKNLFTPDDHSLEYVSLDIGDVILQDDTGKERIIFERKTLYDLASSIKDGRYNEQSLRLDCSPVHNHNIVYIIEGDMIRYNPVKGRMDRKTLYSAMTTLNFFKGFSLVRSLCVEETIDIIKNFAYKIQKQNKQTGYYEPNKERLVLNIENGEEQIIEKTETIFENKTHYSEVIKKCKKSNITPNNIGEIMLSNIPGVSSKTAISIMKKYKTIKYLINELEKNKECLKDFKYEMNNGSVRKISSTCIKNIYDFLIVNDI
jgi:ERCC4-type nuclease